MKISILSFLISAMLFGNVLAQNAQFGTIPKDQKFSKVAGEIGGSLFSATYKGDELYLNKLSSDLKIEISQKINTEEIELKKYAWDLLKVDNKLILIIAVSDRDLPAKIYGKTVVNSNGAIVDEKLKQIGEWQGPDLNGKKIFMGKKIKIVSPPDVKGLATTNNKILLYFIQETMISLTNGNKTILLNYCLIDKDLNMFDTNNIIFDSKEEYHTENPVTDVEGNFYFIARAYNASTRLDHYLGYIYNCSKKQIQSKELPFERLKKEEKPTGLTNLMINSKNNLSFSGFYGNYGDYGVLDVNGICAGELKLNGDFTYDFQLIDSKLFTKPYTSFGEKTETVRSKVSINSTENFVIVTKSCREINKKGESVGVFSEYAILKRDEDGKLKLINSYSAPVFNEGYYENFQPLLVEGTDKVYMTLAPQKYYCVKLNLTKPSDLVCLLHTFNLKGDIQTAHLYNIEKTNPHPKSCFKLKGGNFTLWGESNEIPVAVEVR